MLYFFSSPFVSFNIIQTITYNQQRTIGNGYIEGIELDGFLREFVSSANPSDAGIGEVSV